MTAPSNSRRRFLKQSAIIGGMPMIVPASVLGRDGKVAPSNRIVLGGIGLGPRGRQVLDRFLKQDDCQFNRGHQDCQHHQYKQCHNDHFFENIEHLFHVFLSRL
ncbi:MAG: hypothetical protein ACPG4K_01240, partial [Haloferula sp.]